jgi:predicted RecB family nuclease
MPSATDIANFLACHHLLRLERAQKRGHLHKPFSLPDPGLDLLRELGIRHEQAYLRYLTDVQGLRVVPISTDTSWEDAVAKTVEAICGGADAIYQATFRSAPWIGRADFLIRRNRPSSLGDFSYEVVETKLARSTKARAILQLCFYSDLLAKIQGVLPEWMVVVLGSGSDTEKFAAPHYLAYFRKVKRDFEEAYKSSSDTYPEPVELCDVCAWFTHCDRQRRADDHLSFVAGITRLQRNELSLRQIDTMARLASLALPVEPKIERIGNAALVRIQRQALLQVRGREEGRTISELIGPVEEAKGLAALPLRSQGDIFLDFEAVPYVFETGLEYLIGMVTVPEQPDAEPKYESQWSFDPAAEKKAFEQLIAFVTTRQTKYPDLHIYHYGPYEQTAIKRLAGRHGVCVDKVDEFLRAGVFVDLYRIVRQALRASVESYSIKKIEALYDFSRQVRARDAVVALQTFEAALTLGDEPEATEQIRAIIQVYNRDDCLSTLRLRDWLEDRRREEEVSTGHSLPRPAAKSGEPSQELKEDRARVDALTARLLAGLPPDQATWAGEQYGCWLLAQMLDWHRREEKSTWWEYYRLSELSEPELLEDKSALGGLTYLGVVRQEKRSLIHRYHFPPQDHAIDRARSVHDPRTGKSAGKVVAIDELNRTIELRRGVSADVAHAAALVPLNYVESKVLSDSLFRLGSWVPDHGIDSPGPFRAARDLLLRQPPSSLPDSAELVIDHDGQLTEAAKKLVLSLTHQASVLPIQGPPGSGKTFTGARMIVDLVKEGYQVGIVAASHKVISHFLDRVCAMATRDNVQLRAVQMGGDETDFCDHPMVTQVKQNQDVLDALTRGEASVAAGTVWLWARSEMATSVDVLFVDEAGQMSLANVLAVAQAATSSVLLGDPQQLEQPQKGIHPPGAEGSAFDHLLRGHATISAKEGLFLTETHRLHPDVCGFTSELFYDNRLEPRPENRRQRLNTQGPLDGTGLRFVSVVHSGNQSESVEEVERIAALINDLFYKGSSWTNKKGEPRELTLNDLLIVAPYNAQVAALRHKLPEGARVGTVDKFQGQEAPIVFYSMTTSAPEDAPRGMEFLYSLNRLNVAVSRARCVAVVVASPVLFQVECKTPRQMMLANAFCRYLEKAKTV